MQPNRTTRLSGNHPSQLALLSKPKKSTYPVETSQATAATGPSGPKLVLWDTGLTARLSLCTWHRKQHVIHMFRFGVLRQILQMPWGNMGVLTDGGEAPQFSQGKLFASRLAT